MKSLDLRLNCDLIMRDERWSLRENEIDPQSSVNCRNKTLFVFVYGHAIKFDIFKSAVSPVERESELFVASHL